MLFTAVVLGIVDEAVGLARTQLRRRADDLRAYEQVEWARAEQDHWLAVQAYEGGLRAAAGDDLDLALHGSLRAKQAVADLAEDTLRPPGPGARRRDVQPALAVLALVRGRTGPRLPPPAVGPGLRQPVRHLVPARRRG